MARYHNMSTREIFQDLDRYRDFCRNYGTVSMKRICTTIKNILISSSASLKQVKMPKTCGALTLVVHHAGVNDA